MADRQSPEIHVAQADIAGARAGVLSSKAYPNPVADYLNGHQYQRMSDAVPGQLQHYGFAQQIDLRAQRSARIAAARLAETSTQFGLDEARLRVRSGVKQAFYEVLRRQSESQVAEEIHLSVPASVGFIALWGIAVLNGVVLVSYIRSLRRTGTPLFEAIKEGANLRFRPVMMTASVAALGLIPFLFATGPGSEVQRPLAIVVIGGLITSTLLTLIVLPALYPFFDDVRSEVSEPILVQA